MLRGSAQLARLIAMGMIHCVEGGDNVGGPGEGTGGSVGSGGGDNGDRSGGDFGPPASAQDRANQQEAGGNLDRSGGEFGPPAGPQERANQREADVAAFDAFSLELDEISEKLGAVFGFGPDKTGAVERGAALSDPAAVSAGRKAGVGFELASTLASTVGLAPSLAVAAVRGITASLSDPAFGIGLAQTDNPLGSAANLAGAVSGIATGSARLGQLTELGTSLAGVSLEAQDVGLTGDVTAADRDDDGVVGDSVSPRPTSDTVTPQVLSPIGARIELSESPVTTQQRTASVARNTGRSSLRVRRT